MSIPKIIHLCWFGSGEKSAKIQRCMRTIERLAAHGYEIRMWDETKYDLGKSKLLQAAAEAGRWSLVSNYVRLDVLNQFGGIYLDTDIEVLRPFDDLLDNDFFCGFMWDCNLGTAAIGCVAGNEIVSGILAGYERDPSTFKSPNNDTFTEYFLATESAFRLNGKAQRPRPKIALLDKYAFEHPSLGREKNYTIHHFEQSWKKSSSFKMHAKHALIGVFSLYLYRRYVCWKSLRISPFYQQYLRHTGSSLAIDGKPLDERS